MRIKIFLAGFMIPIAVFTMAAVIDVITDESDPGALIAFLVEVPALIALPVFSFKKEKKLSGRLTAKQYNTSYLLGYLLAAAAVFVFMCSVDVGRFFPERDESVWLDLRGLGLLFLESGVIAGFFWALIFRGIAALVRLSKK